MKTLICIHLILVVVAAATASTCCAQQMNGRRNPIKYALISYPPPAQTYVVNDNHRKHFPNKASYTRYVDYVSFCYNTMFSLDAGKRDALYNALTRYFSRDAVSVASVHALLDVELKRLLNYVQYAEWLRLRNYPEYNESFLF